MKMFIMLMVVFLIFLNFNKMKCIPDEQYLNNEESENSEIKDCGAEDGNILADEFLNTDDKFGKSEADGQAEEISQNVDESVLNNEKNEEKKSVNYTSGETDPFDKYKGVFGGYGDPVHSRRVKRFEE